MENHLRNDAKPLTRPTTRFFSLLSSVFRSPFSRRGQTLPALIAGLVAAAILALLAGTILVSAYRALRRDSAAVELQRDGMFAIDILSRALRRVSSDDVSFSNNDLRVKEKSFFANGTNLEYDPDTSNPDDEVTLVHGRLYSLAVTNIPRGVAVSLELREGSDKAEFNTIVTFRN